MQKIIAAFIVLITLNANAQYKVTFTVNSLPAYHAPAENIFIAGSFNNWQPAGNQYLLKNKSITIELPAGEAQYKFTRGGWDKAEAAKGGNGAENRKLLVTKDTTIEIAIEEWADHFAAKEKRSSANKNVQIIQTAFYIPQLNRYRRIWVYLPASYNTSHKKYDVMYMHDGQNVFEDTTSFSGEWGVDEAADTLGIKIKECIVVGIDNGGDKRLNEYSPFDMQRFGKGEGDMYVDFIVKTLKPFIEKKYRVKKCYKHQYIAGSSMGGLISFYAMLKYPKEFGGAGVFSPAFWVVMPQLKPYVEQRAKKVKGKIYFYAGQKEGEEMVPDMLSVFDQMNRLSKAKMTTVIRAEGKHNEPTWRAEFPLFYKWMFTGKK